MAAKTRKPAWAYMYNYPSSDKNRYIKLLFTFILVGRSLCNYSMSNPKLKPPEPSLLITLVHLGLEGFA